MVPTPFLPGILALPDAGSPLLRAGESLGFAYLSRRIRGGTNESTFQRSRCSGIAPHCRTACRPKRVGTGEGEGHHAGNPLRFGAELLQAATRALHGGGRRRRDQLEG